MAKPMQNRPMIPELVKALADAKRRWEAMTPEEQEAELRLQLESWTRQDMD